MFRKCINFNILSSIYIIKRESGIHLSRLLTTFASYVTHNLIRTKACKCTYGIPFLSFLQSLEFSKLTRKYLQSVLTEHLVFYNIDALLYQYEVLFCFIAVIKARDWEKKLSQFSLPETNYIKGCQSFLNKTVNLRLHCSGIRSSRLEGIFRYTSKSLYPAICGFLPMFISSL